MREGKIGVMGDPDSVMGFAAVGLDVFPVEPEDAGYKLHELAKDYAVLFVTEGIAACASEAIDRYKTVPYPAVIIIPGNAGSTGLGLKHVRENVEKAIGIDMLFGDTEKG